MKWVLQTLQSKADCNRVVCWLGEVHRQDVFLCFPYGNALCWGSYDLILILLPPDPAVELLKSEYLNPVPQSRYYIILYQLPRLSLTPSLVHDFSMTRIAACMLLPLVSYEMFRETRTPFGLVWCTKALYARVFGSAFFSWFLFQTNYTQHFDFDNLTKTTKQRLSIASKLAKDKLEKHLKVALIPRLSYYHPRSLWYPLKCFEKIGRNSA